MIRRLLGQAGSNPAAVPEQRDDAGSVIGGLTVPHPVISRRRFLAWAGAAAIVVPTVKYFLPPVGGWPNSLDGFTTDPLRYKAYERYSAGWVDGRAFYGTSDGVALNSTPHPSIDYDEISRRYAEALERSFAQTTKEALDKHLRSTYGTWYLKLEPKALKTIEADLPKPLVIHPGRRWWKA